MKNILKLKFIAPSFLIGIILLIAIIQFSGIGIRSLFPGSDPEDILTGQVGELKEEIAVLKSENEKYILRNTELQAEVQRLVASQPGGVAVEEKRKGLVQKEAELKDREKRLARREETIRLAEKKIATQQQKFYKNTGLRVEEIGEAKQIKREYEYMRLSLEKYEARGNNWLKAFFLLLVTFVGLVVFLVYMHYKNRKIDATMRVIESFNMSAQDKNVLIASLGGRLIEQSGDKDDRQ